MPFFVAVHQEVQPERLDQVLGAMRGDFATSRRTHPGRRSTRVFQRLNYPNHLQAIGEWDTEDGYEQLRQIDSYQSMTASADPPASIEYSKRLRLFARMSVPPAIVGCVTIAAPPEHAEALEALILNDVHFSVEATPGLLAHEVYRVGGQVGRLLVIHGWRSLEALESFRAGARTSYAPRLRELNVSAERLTGIVAVQLSRFEE